MIIGVVGGGVVGRAVARCWMEHAEVRVNDILKERSTHKLKDVLQANIIFVCLPTPKQPDGMGCDASALWDFFTRVQEFKSSLNLVIRSTVPIGFTEQVRGFGFENVVHSPEFITARCANIDIQVPSRNIVGYNWHYTNICANWLESLYKTRFPGVPVHVMRSEESEAVKLFQNGFFATKVAYWNECYRLAECIGLDWHRVMEGVLSDGRITHAHTQVPGPDGKTGFGGTCLPKDLANLTHCITTNLGAEHARVTKAVYERNNDIDRRDD